MWQTTLVLAFVCVAVGQYYTYPCLRTLGSQSDLTALNDFYQATGGFTWAVNTGWPTQGSASTVDPCCWVGVTCAQQANGQVRVSELNFGYNNLIGTIPDSISTFDKLTKLILQFNKLSGTIPAAIGQMSNLQLLFLNNNQFSGSVPSFNLPLLTTFYFESNMLSGNFPDASQYPSLQAIDGSNNQFTGSIPPLTSSTVVDMRGNNNQLSGALDPGTLTSLTLQTFEFAYNQLSGPVPPISSSIKVLNVAGNSLGCFAPQAVGTDLNITGNSFLCSSGVARVADCVTPSIMTLISPTAPVQLNNGGLTVTASFTLSNPAPLRGCPNMFCYLGLSQMGSLSGPDGSGTFTCTLTPMSVGAFALSVRTGDGTVVTQQTNGNAIIVNVQAGCAGPNNNCNSPQGTCTPQGCVCNQQAGWQGTDCNSKICPRNCFTTSTPPHGTCNTNNGTCSCNTGWGGADCSVPQMSCPGDGTCNAPHGACVKTTGQCQCYPVVQADSTVPASLGPRNFTYVYSGATCETFVCPKFTLPDGTMQVCSGHGTCTSTACNCNPMFVGADCSIGTYQCPQGCPANISSCDHTSGNCACTRGLTGDQCQFHVCPSTSATEPCSGHGTCDMTTGLCDCDPMWDVLGSCSVMKIACPMQGPNGPGNLSAPCGGPQFGECKETTGQCACVNNALHAYSGAACDTPICPNAWRNCNPNQLSPPAGMCVNAACQCAAGYSGQTCASINCPLGTDGSQCSVNSGKGTCDGGSGICQCLMVGQALDPKTGCSSALCPSSNNVVDCSGNGKCNNGACVCNSGWSGSGCSSPVENPLPIALGVVGAILFVCSCAVAAFFFLRHRAIKKLTAERH